MIFFKKKIMESVLNWNFRIDQALLILASNPCMPRQELLNEAMSSSNPWPSIANIEVTICNLIATYLGIGIQLFCNETI